MYTEKVVYSVKWERPEGVILLTTSVLDWVTMHTYLISSLGKDCTSLFNDIRLAHVIYADQWNMKRSAMSHIWDKGLRASMEPQVPFPLLCPLIFQKEAALIVWILEWKWPRADHSYLQELVTWLRNQSWLFEILESFVIKGWPNLSWLVYPSPQSEYRPVLQVIVLWTSYHYEGKASFSCWLFRAFFLFLLLCRRRNVLFPGLAR